MCVVPEMTTWHVADKTIREILPDTEGEVDLQQKPRCFYVVTTRQLSHHNFYYKPALNINTVTELMMMMMMMMMSLCSMYVMYFFSDELSIFIQTDDRISFNLLKHEVSLIHQLHNTH